MSWTVQEDEYRVSGSDNVVHAPSVVSETLLADTSRRKPSGKYTQSTQVFAPVAVATYPEAYTPMKEPIEPISGGGWNSARSPVAAATAAPVPLYSSPGAPSFSPGQGSFAPRFQSSMCERGMNSMPSPYATMPRRGKIGSSNSGAAFGRPISAEAPRTSSLPVDERDFVAGDGVKWGAASARMGPPQHPSPVNVTPDGLRGHVYEIAKDQHGCRYLQRWLDTNYDVETLQVIMTEIIPHVAELMTDQYANFLVQKLFDTMPDDVRYSVACVAAPEIVAIALTPHGTFSVQKMIETISTREEMEIVRESLANDVVCLVKDLHGNHVVQKVLQRFDYADKQFIYDAVMTDCTAIAKNKQGCCVLQRCLEYASPQQRAILIKHILSCCLDIVQDPFGNYVIQYVLDSREPSVNDTIAVMFLPHIVYLCINKFSSNVMEKVLRGASVGIQEMYVETLCNPDIATRLIQDDYGNYVLQTALSITTSRWGERLIAVLRPLMPLIKNAPYAKKLEGKMESLVRRNACDGGSGGGSGGLVYRGGYNNNTSSSIPRTDYSSGRANRGMPYNTHHRFHEPRSSTWQPS